MSVKKQLLDPLGTLCKLVALNFSDLKTKISIHNHVLWLQKPNNYQFVVRFINGDGKENVSELFYAIIRVIKWYLAINIKNENGTNDINEITDTDENWVQIAKNEEIKRIVKYVCTALRKLQETYEYGNVILAIQYYIVILEDAMNGNYNDSKLPQFIIDKEKEFGNLIDYEKMKNMWDYKKLKRICDLYDGCFGVYNDAEMPDTEKAALIDGYLGSINKILELADAEFQKLIQNSSRG